MLEKMEQKELMSLTTVEPTYLPRAAYDSVRKRTTAIPFKAL